MLTVFRVIARLRHLSRLSGFSNFLSNLFNQRGSERGARGLRDGPHLRQHLSLPLVLRAFSSSLHSLFSRSPLSFSSYFGGSSRAKRIGLQAGDICFVLSGASFERPRLRRGETQSHPQSPRAGSVSHLIRFPATRPPAAGAFRPCTNVTGRVLRYK